MCRQNDRKSKLKLCKTPVVRNTGRAGAIDPCTARPALLPQFPPDYIISHFWTFVKGFRKNFSKKFSTGFVENPVENLGITGDCIHNNHLFLLLHSLL
jgi:hypothetical protein